MIGGFLKIVFSVGWFSMNLQFSITICLSLLTAGWYVVTKGNILSAVLCFCDLRADCLESKVTSWRTNVLMRGEKLKSDKIYVNFVIFVPQTVDAGSSNCLIGTNVIKHECNIATHENHENQIDCALMSRDGFPHVETPWEIWQKMSNLEFRQNLGKTD